MAFLVDTPVLLRLANTDDSRHLLVSHAVAELHRRGEILHVTAQNLIEFRNAATRPVAANGLGLSLDAVEEQATKFESMFPLLAETPDVFPAWKTLVHSAGVIGKQVHDARLAAVCHVHSVTHVLTFNVRHFTRLAAFEPGLVVIDPAMV